MKLDLGYSYYQSFKENYATGDLIKCFESILLEEKIINLHELNKILNKDSLSNQTPATYVIQEFLNLFSIIQINSLTQKEFYYTKRNEIKYSDIYHSNLLKSNSNLIEVDGLENGNVSSKVKHKLKVRTPKISYQKHQIG